MHSNSPHILNTSSNLLGFSFLVLSAIKGFGLPQHGFVDELVALLIVVFAVSCVFSFGAMRTGNTDRAAQYETYAEYLFLAGLLLVALLSVLLGLDIVLFSS